MDWKKKVEETFDIVAEPATDIVSSMFLEGLIGTVVPGATSAMLSYKQKRSEHMIERFMIQTQKRLNEFEENLKNLDPSIIEEIKTKYFGITLDYVSNTKQEEKIEYLVNGFINIANMDILQEDIILIFYDTLSELNLLDLRILKMYGNITGDDNYYKIVDETGIDNSQYTLIVNKLERLGLIQSRAQSQYDEIFMNVVNIGEYLCELEKGRKAKLKYKKPFGASFSTSKQITNLGRRFLEFFTEKDKKTNK